MTRRLIMIRHGQTDYNATRRMQGQLDTELSETGIAQAYEAAEMLASYGITRMISSDLKRAANTAEIIAGRLGLSFSVDKRLRETHLGQWQGMTHGEVDGGFPGRRAHWRNDASWAPPEGESRLEVAARARQVIDELMVDHDSWDDSALLVVAHGGTISALTSNLLGLQREQYPLLGGLSNTHWSMLQARPRYRPEAPAVSFAQLPTAEATWYLEAWNMGPAV